MNGDFSKVICKYCKKEYDNADSCPYCGRSAKDGILSMPKRYIACLAILVVGLVTAASFLALNMRPSPYMTDDEAVITVENDGQTLFIVNGKCVGSIDGKIESSLTGAGNMAFVSGGVLYKVDRSSLEQIADDVVAFTMSSNGKKTAYINTVGELYLYGGKSKLIDYNVIASGLCISRKGALAYVKQETAGDVMYTYTSGKPSRIKEGRYPVSISDGAGVVFATDASLNLYRIKSKKESKIGENIVSDSMSVSYDRSQILFCTSDGEYIYSSSAGAVKIGNGAYSMLRVNNEKDMQYQSYAASIVGVRSFFEKFYLSFDGELIKVDKKGTPSEVDTGVDGGYAFISGKSAVYKKDGKLFKCRYSSLKKTEMASDVADFTVSADGRYLYYTDSSKAFYVAYASRKAKKKADTCAFFTVFDGDYCQYVTDDGNIYAMRGTRSSKQVGEGASAFVGRVKSCAYTCADGIYYGSGNKKQLKKYEKK